jgi:hypothetical protein
VQTVLKRHGPKDDQSRATLERTGFSDMKYLVWAHKTVNAHQTSQFELSFTGRVGESQPGLRLPDRSGVSALFRPMP